MTKAEYQRTIKRLGLSIIGVGDVVGVGWRQAQRWAHGDTAVPEPIARLLRLMVKHEITPDDVRAMASPEWLQKHKRR